MNRFIAYTLKSYWELLFFCALQIEEVRYREISDLLKALEKCVSETGVDSILLIPGPLPVIIRPNSKWYL